jgi:hypothetical protein
MDSQTLIVALIVAAALVYVGRGWYRTLSLARREKEDGGCAGGCGCSKD